MSGTEEQWRPAVGWEGLYEVSNVGHVRSVARTIVRSNGAPQSIRGGVKAQYPDSAGYMQVTLTRDCISRRSRVHRLVAEAFLDGSGPVVRHLDGDPTNNHVENLAWGTQSDNAFDAVRHGRNRNAAKTHCPRGHRLAEPNLSYANGYRTCRSCTYARVHIHKGRAGDMQTVSDAQYLRFSPDAETARGGAA